MRLAPEILLHLSTKEFATLWQYQRAAKLYDDWRWRMMATPESSRDGKRQRVQTQSDYQRDQAPRSYYRPGPEVQFRSMTCEEYFEPGHVLSEYGRSYISCFSCGGRGHHRGFCPYGRSGEPSQWGEVMPRGYTIEVHGGEFPPVPQVEMLQIEGIQDGTAEGQDWDVEGTEDDIVEDRDGDVEGTEDDIVEDQDWEVEIAEDAE